MGLPFTNLFPSCCTSPSFLFDAGFASTLMALGPCPPPPPFVWAAAHDEIKVDDEGGDVRCVH